MNELIQFLNSHASVRQFTEQNISEEDERLIVTTARRSPTSSNLHAYSIVSVRNETTKRQLSELCGNQAHVAACPLFLVFCADLARLNSLAKSRSYKFNGDTAEAFVIATVDAALAGSRALMAAQALGMGGVMVGGIRNHPAEVSDLLALPELVYPVMGMSLGYPSRVPRTKPRLPIDGLWFREKYAADQIDAAVSEYDRTIDELGYLKGREVESDLYPDFKGSYSWSEHSARRMASDAPGVCRAHLLAYLQDRGFLKR